MSFFQDFGNAMGQSFNRNIGYDQTRHNWNKVAEDIPIIGSIWKGVENALHSTRDPTQTGVTYANPNSSPFSQANVVRQYSNQNNIVPPSYVKRISDPDTKQAIAGTRGFQRTVVDGGLGAQDVSSVGSAVGSSGATGDAGFSPNTDADMS